MAQVVRMHEIGAPDVLRVEQEDVGLPGPGQVRIIQDAIGVNFVDTMVRSGGYPVTLPAIPGFEGAGTVTHTGADGNRFASGDRVAYFFALGGYASERLISADALIKLPPDICTFHAATFLAKGLAAWMALRALHPLRAGGNGADRRRVGQCRQHPVAMGEVARRDGAGRGRLARKNGEGARRSALRVPCGRSGRCR